MTSVESRQPTFEDLETLAQVSQLLMEVDLDAVLQQVIQLATRAVGATKSSLFLHEHNAVNWEHIFTMRDLPPDQAIPVVRRVLDDGFAGWVYSNRRGDVIADTEQDARWIIFPDDPIKVRSAMCVPFMHESEVIAVLTLVHPDPGHFTPYHLRLMTIIANQATVAIRNAQLVSNLNTQQRQLQAVLESIRDVLIVTDRSGTIVVANRAARKLLADSPSQDISGRHLGDFEHIEDIVEPVLNVINDESNTRESWQFEVRSEITRIDYQVAAALWKDSLFGVMGYVVVLHDVTTLYDLHRFKDEMLRVASHDLRSPLALIAGYADMVAVDTPDDESPVHEYIDIIKKSVDRMGGLIDDLLRVERIRNSPLELHEQTDIESLVKVALVNMRPSAVVKNQNFTADLTLRDDPHIMADPVLLRQAMENLIGNAIKYTPEEGRIAVRAYVEDEQFHFFVQDNGIGIPQEHLPYVFESFYRVNHASNTQKGSGLGLSLVKNVIARHGGQVWVKSQLNKGSRFGFSLPVTQPTEPPEDF